MIKYFCAWMCTIAWVYSCAQNDTTSSCQCDKDLAFVTQYLEDHYAGFTYNVTTANRSAYDSLKNELRQLLQQPLSETACLAVLKKYASFFRDNHLQIRLKNPVPANRRPPTVQPANWFRFTVLNDSTTYLYIRTFDGAMKARLDSAYAQVLPQIAQKPNLLIDIRDNGGGSDQCWRPLARYLYTQPFTQDETMYYCSPEVVKRNEERLTEMKKNRRAYGWKTISYTKIKLRKIRKAPPGSFISFKKTIPWYARPFVYNKTYSQQKIYATPQKVILLYNRRTQSAAEGFILEAMHSSKVLTFGENSGGAITFGDVRLTTTPSGFILQSATQATLNRFRYERTGIPPQVLADTNSDWIMQACGLWDRIPQSRDAEGLQTH